MAGFVVHLAVAEEYIRKHGNIKNHNEFLLGAIKPDLYEDKKVSHYGIKTSKPNLKRYLDENTLDSDLNKGYLLHLVIDEVSELNLEEIINEINNDDPKWKTFKTLEKR